MEEIAAGGRFPGARLQPLPSLCSVQGLQLVLFPQESQGTSNFRATALHEASEAMQEHIFALRRLSLFLLSMIRSS
ncbi:hypothetical protein I858_004655 [Planococcus versutus]|uniref:Uncharacterized protein n=1 Tax=Planococcus versutus TaxID=1302659 RepID=A0A1B1RZF4_9BACL|nr:hypothetical protein I858_004655 [Planococcus versutus]